MWRLNVKKKESYPSSARVQSHYRSYSPTAMTHAYISVQEEGSSIRGAARKFGVPEATLRDRISGRVECQTLKSGRSPLFSIEEEAHLVEHLKVMSNCGYGYSRAEVVDLATNYAISLQRKTDDDKPLTMMWFQNFKKRWPELKVVKPRGLELQRAKATSEECVTSYFKELDNILTKYNIKDAPQRIYNIDEKGLQQNHTPPQVVTSSNGAVPSAVVSGKGSTITVIGCGNALGQQIPPYFIFPGKRMREELMKGATPGCAGTVSDSGWSNTEIFKSYLQDHFIKFVQGKLDDNYTLVLYDGHRSHINIGLIDWAKQHRIILFILPAHTSHILQPLDVGCFGPFERIYNAECHKYMRQNAVRGIDRYSICELACKSYVKALSPDNLQSSFRKSGIYPYNPDAVDRSNFIPSQVLKAAAHEVTKDTALLVQDNEQNGDAPNIEQKSSSTDNLPTSTSKERFFVDKEKQLVQTKKENTGRKRKCLSHVVSGQAITEEKTKKKIEDHIADQLAHKKTPKPQEYAKAGPSSTKTQIKKTKKQAIKIQNSDSESEEIIQETDLCCVCKLYRPIQLQNSLYFTTWGQCMFENCLHWTHLRYCCQVLRLRSRDTFYCPCHQINEE